MYACMHACYGDHVSLSLIARSLAPNQSPGCRAVGRRPLPASHRDGHPAPRSHATPRASKSPQLREIPLTQVGSFTWLEEYLDPRVCNIIAFLARLEGLGPFLDALLGPGNP